MPSLSPIATISSMARAETISFTGVVMQVDRASQLTTSKGRLTEKRLLLLADDSNSNVRCTLWGDEALDATTIQRGDTLLILNGEINDYNGTRSINVGSSARAIHKPLFPRADSLNEWYDQLDTNVQFNLPEPTF